MKILNILVAGIGIAGMLVLAMPVQATDAEEITGDLFAELEAVADAESINALAFESMQLAQADMDAGLAEYERARAERDEEMDRVRVELAHAREEMEKAAREMARRTGHR